MVRLKISELIKGYYTYQDGFVPYSVYGFGIPDNPFDNEELIKLRLKNGQTYRVFHTQISFNKKDILHVFEVAYMSPEEPVLHKHLYTVDLYREWPYIWGCHVIKRNNKDYYIDFGRFVFQTKATTIKTQYDPADYIRPTLKPVSKDRLPIFTRKIFPLWQEGLSVTEISKDTGITPRIIKSMAAYNLLPARTNLA